MEEVVALNFFLTSNQILFSLFLYIADIFKPESTKDLLTHKSVKRFQRRQSINNKNNKTMFILNNI